MWKEEKVKSSAKHSSCYSICCKNSKILLPPLAKPPASLAFLLDPSIKHPLSKRFQVRVRSFNSMFAMTSHGAKVVQTVMDGRGPYTFRMHGQNSHVIGSLLPTSDSRPKYAQLYIYDIEHEVDNRLSAFQQSQSIPEADTLLDQEIVLCIKDILDKKNKYVKQFRKA